MENGKSGKGNRNDIGKGKKENRIDTTGTENRKRKKGKGERETGKGYGTRDMGIWDMVCRKGHVGTWEGITYPVNG